MDQKEFLFALFRSELTDQPCFFKAEEVTPSMLSNLYEISKEQDLTHIVGNALEKTGLFSQDPALEQKFLKQQMLAIYRYERLNFEYTRVCALFEDEKILHVPLKGSVLRQYYPQPYMRTSCDIDILVKDEDLDKAVSVLCEKFGYKTEGGKKFHDFNLFSPSGVHLELHHNIKEDIASMDHVLSTVWDHVYCPEGFTYCRLQTPEFLYFHQIAHAAYHFIKGGCGIRPAMDIFLLKKHLRYDQKKLDELLKAAELQTFSEAFFKLCDVWFAKEEHSPLTLEMERYILDGGVYGSVDNGVAMGRAVQKNKFFYVWERVFLPYKKMKGRFPILQKHPLLLPIMHIYRWLRIIFGKRRSLAVSIIKSNSALNEEKKDRVSALREDLNLK